MKVVALITDGEEAGLRGAKAFAKKHYKEYVESGVETSVLCVDTLTDLDYLNVYNRDMTALCPKPSRQAMRSSCQPFSNLLTRNN